MTDEQYVRCAIDYFEPLPDGEEDPLTLDHYRLIIEGLAERTGHAPMWYFEVLRFCFEFHELTADQAHPIVMSAIREFDPAHSVNPSRWLDENYNIEMRY